MLKKNIILFLTVLFLPLISCKRVPEANREQQRIDSLKIALDSVETGLLALEKKYHAGLVKYKEYVKYKSRLEKAYQEVSVELGGLHQAYSLPRWAKELGLFEPEGMLLDSALSQETSVDRPGEGFNSITLVYISSPDSARHWADSIANSAGLTKSEEYLVRSRTASKIKESDSPGATYLNYDLKAGDKDYLISVNADSDGILTITATNMKQLNEKLSDYRSLKIRNDKKMQGKKQ